MAAAADRDAVAPLTMRAVLDGMIMAHEIQGVLGMGAAFEFPLLVVLAVYIGLVEVATLRRYRRHALAIQ